MAFTPRYHGAATMLIRRATRYAIMRYASEEAMRHDATRDATRWYDDTRDDGARRDVTRRGAICYAAGVLICVIARARKIRALSRYDAMP